MKFNHLPKNLPSQPKKANKTNKLFSLQSMIALFYASIYCKKQYLKQGARVINFKGLHVEFKKTYAKHIKLLTKVRKNKERNVSSYGHFTKIMNQLLRDDGFTHSLSFVHRKANHGFLYRKAEKMFFREEAYILIITKGCGMKTLQKRYLFSGNCFFEDYADKRYFLKKAELNLSFYLKEIGYKSDRIINSLTKQERLQEQLQKSISKFNTFAQNTCKKFRLGMGFVKLQVIQTPSKREKNNSILSTVDNILDKDISADISTTKRATLLSPIKGKFSEEKLLKLRQFKQYVFNSEINLSDSEFMELVPRFLPNFITPNGALAYKLSSFEKNVGTSTQNEKLLDGIVMLGDIVNNMLNGTPLLWEAFFNGKILRWDSKRKQKIYSVPESEYRILLNIFYGEAKAEVFDEDAEVRENKKDFLKRVDNIFQIFIKDFANNQKITFEKPLSEKSNSKYSGKYSDFIPYL